MIGYLSQTVEQLLAEERSKTEPDPVSTLLGDCSITDMKTISNNRPSPNNMNIVFLIIFIWNQVHKNIFKNQF